MTSSEIALYDGNGIERFRGTQSPAGGGGSQPGAMRMLGPFTLAYADFTNDAVRGWSYAFVYTPTVGEAMLGCAWLLREAFNDSALPGIGMDLTALDLSGGGFNTGNVISPNAIQIDLLNVQGNGTGNVDGDYVYGGMFVPASYVIQAGTTSIPQDLTSLPVASNGMPLYVNGQLMNGDGDQGSIDFYLFVATPAAP